jgi:hypothetical protein
MRAAVTRDTITRVINLEVSGVPDLDVTENWHRKPRVIRPDYLVITLVDGDVRSAETTGGLVLKSGAASDGVGDKREWTSNAYGYRLDDAPEWVRTLTGEAVLGVTAWSYPDSSNPEEVLSL